jgi:NAD(P)-dependent dehydrogenase (short-subunit alcohol dehydrogenase family)
VVGRLAGKVCVITGTGGSIGRATALTFAREGASVVGCDVTVEQAAATVGMVRAAGGEMVSLHPCYLNDPTECARLAELAVSAFGRIDVLFNLAAQSHFHWLEGFTDEDWDAARRDEVDLVFYLARAAWPHLKASRGVVVNMASLNGSLSFKNLPWLAHTTNKAAAGGRPVGPRHARQDTAGSPRPAAGRGERRAVPRVRRELLRDRHRPRGRWRHEGVVTSAVARQRRRFDAQR